MVSDSRKVLVEIAEEYRVAGAEEYRVAGAEDERPVSKAQARWLVDRLWLERPAEREAGGRGHRLRPAHPRLRESGDGYGVEFAPGAASTQ